MSEFIFDVLCLVIAGCIAFFLIRGVSNSKALAANTEPTVSITSEQPSAVDSQTSAGVLDISKASIKRKHLGLEIGAVSDFETIEAAVRAFLGEEIVSKIVDEGNLHSFRFASKANKEFGYGGGTWQIVSILLSGNRIMTISFDKGFKNQETCKKAGGDILQGIVNKYGKGQAYEGGNSIEFSWADKSTQMNFKTYQWDAPTLPWHIEISYSDIKMLNSASSALDF